MTWDVALLVLGIALVALGLLGAVLPLLPGTPLVFLGILLVAAADRFERISVGTVVALGVVTVLVAACDYAATALGVKKLGGSRWGMVGAVVGLFVGLLLPPIGLLVGPLLGAIAGEMLSGRPRGEATRAGLGALLGFVAGLVVKVVAAIGMVIVGTWAYFR